MLKLNKAALPDPAAVHQAQRRDDDQVASLCNGCRYGFRVAAKQRWGDHDSNLAIWCTGPWFEHAQEMYSVTACNGYVEGEFSPVTTAMEVVKKALGVDPYEGMAPGEKAAHLDASLSDLEAEGDGVEKAMETEEGEASQDGADAEPENNNDSDDGGDKE